MACASAAFFDPQYRDLLNRLDYGNEGDRQSDRAALPQMDELMICNFMEEIARVLKPSAHAFLWVDKFIMVEGKWRQWLPQTLACVDMITWNKCRNGMGYRSRSRTEFLIVLQKRPLRAKQSWKDHGIDDCWTETVDRSQHPHTKPVALIQRLIRCVTEAGDLVVDPAAGSFTVLDACLATARGFFGCDLIKSP